MPDLAYGPLLPIGIVVVLMGLGRLRALYWWSTLVLVGVGIAAVLMSRGGLDEPWKVLVGTFVLFFLPIALMFVVLRADLFERRLYLMPLVGVVVYGAGCCSRCPSSSRWGSSSLRRRG